MEHDLKTIEPYFTDVLCGDKTFEIRKNDRGFKPFDVLILKEYKRGEFTGREIRKKIGYVLEDAEQFGLKDGYVILALHEDE